MWLLQCCLLVQVLTSRAAYYHELSMTTIEPPVKLHKDAFFGYSVAYQRNGLLVSAPQADEDGQVFSCNLETKSCSKMHFTIGGTRNEQVPGTDSKSSKNVEHKHNFWLGATMKADKHHAFVCMPRLTNNIQVQIAGNGTNEIFGTSGVCYFKDSSSESNFAELPQIKTEDRSLGATTNENATDSFGWSMETPYEYSIEKNTKLWVGSPAPAAGRVMTYRSFEDRSVPNMLSSKKKHGYNFGYSIANGVFINTSRSFRTDPKPWVAIGTPYGEDGIGKVYLLNENQDLKQTVADPAGVGSMFSAALCAARLGGNSTSLLVGAPAHFTESNYHTGIVYVYRQDSATRSRIPTIKILKEIKGPNKDGAFFGYAISNVGDLDHDNLDEIAIAAPYEDKGRGAVYLYAGSAIVRDGEPSWLQRFQPEARGFRNLGVSVVANKYFGESCNELAIGAPGDDKVAVYHCLTVITVNVETIVPDLQKRDDKTHFAFDLCLNATYPPKPDKINADFAVRVKITHPNAKLTDASGNNDYVDYNMTLESFDKKKNTCRKIDVKTSEDGDYEQEIQINITATLLNDPTTSTVYDPSRASVSVHSALTAGFSVRAAECKMDPCAPDLTVQLTTSAKSPYVIGSSKNESIGVVVSNGDADTAYRPCVRVSAAGAGLRSAPQCTVAGDQRVCQLQRPLTKIDPWEFTESEKIELDMTSLTSESDEIEVTAEVFNRCDMTKAPNSEQTIKINLTTDIAGVKLQSKTDQGEIVQFTKEDIKTGKIIHHTYTITNMGEINWVNLYCNISLFMQPYIVYNNLVQIYKGETARGSCELKGYEKGSDFHFGCKLDSLNRKEVINVVIPIIVLPGQLEKVFEKANGTVKTRFTLHVETHELDKIEISTLMLQEATAVPVWAIVVAAIVGIIILVLIAFALRECGFLRRKKKEKLENLQQEVKRKSMMLQRQSMRLTEAARLQLQNLTYRELLDAAAIKEAEEEEDDEIAQKAIIKDRRIQIKESEGKNKGCTSKDLNGKSPAQDQLLYKSPNTKLDKSL